MTDLFIYRAVIENNSIKIVQLSIWEEFVVEKDSLRCKADGKKFFLKRRDAVNYLKSKVFKKVEEFGSPELKDILKIWIKELVTEWRNKNTGMAIPRVHKKE